MLAPFDHVKISDLLFYQNSRSKNNERIHSETRAKITNLKFLLKVVCGYKLKVLTKGGMWI